MKMKPRGYRVSWRLGSIKQSQVFELDQYDMALAVMKYRAAEGCSVSIAEAYRSSLWLPKGK